MEEVMSKFSVKKPYTIFVAVIAIIILGVIAFTHMTTDLLPSLNLPYVVVYTTYPGASPEKVETAVTKPMEQALATTGGLKDLSSTSSENVSMLVMEFTGSTNMDSAMIEMSNAIDQIKGYWPDEVGAPIMMRINPDMLPIMIASVDIDGADLAALSDTVNAEVIPSLERVDGVASVSASGLLEENLSIQLSAEKIAALNARILAVVDEELADTEQDLIDARAELNRGREALNSARRTQTRELNEAEEQLTAAIGQLSGMLPNFEANRAAADQQIAALKGQQTQLAAASSDYTTLLANITALEAALEANPEDAASAAQLAALAEARGTAESGISAMYLAALPDGKAETASAQLEELTAFVASSLTALEQMPATRSDAEAQLETLNTQLTAVTEGKATLKKELRKAEKSLDEGDEQLTEGEQQFEEAREAAYKAAGLDGVITPSMISGILTAQNFSMPAGYVGEGEDQIIVKVGEAITSVEETENLLLFHIDSGDIGDVRLKDVAEVTLVDNSSELYTKINQNNGILLTFEKQSMASTSEVCDDLAAAMAELEAKIPGLHMTALQDQGMYIHLVTDSVIDNLLYGAVLAIIVLILFLRNYRPTLITALSIPISVMFAIVLMYFSGVTLNIISLSGLALGVGMLVDNSIVVIENIYRLRSLGLSAAKAAIQGAKEVAGAIASSTLTTICVFLPIVFTEGLTRELFTDMALTITYSLVASLLVALTLVPAMASGLLRKSKDIKVKWFDKLTNAYGRSVAFTLRHKAPVLILAVALMVFAAVSVFSMGTTMFPKMDSPFMSVSLIMPEDATIEENRAMSDAVIERIIDIPELNTIGAMEGGSMLTLSGGDGISYYMVMDENKSRTNEEIKEEILELTADLDCELSIQAQTMDMSMLTGSGISVTIHGKDLDKLREVGREVAALFEGVEGIAEVSDGSGETTPELRISIDRDAAMGYGLTVAQIYQDLATALTMETSSSALTVEEKEYPTIILSKEALNEETLLDHVLTGTKEGEEVEFPLSEIATVTLTDSMASINRDLQGRYLTVTATIADGYNIGLVSREFDKVLADYEPPAGYTVLSEGEDQTINEMLEDVITMILLAIVLIYLIMVAQFQSLLSPFIVLFTIPLAFTGGLLALLITGFEVSIVSLMGLLVLSGVVVNNGIVFVDCANQLRLGGMEKHDALVETGKRRLRPILMTALTTILALSTMAAGVGMGADMLQPMAVVTIGGLTYSTILTLYVVPAIYDLFHRKAMKKHGEDAE